MDYADFLTGVYRDQLGRAPDEGGMTFYTKELTSGAKTVDDVIREINQSLEGQNFDTQLVTSEYRTELGRNPEQEGYAYWMSRLQSDPTLNSNNLEAFIRGGAAGTDVQRLGLAPDQYLEIISNALEADPYGGRYATNSIYDVAQGGADSLQAQFVTPVTMRPVNSTYDAKTGQFITTAGADILDPNRVANAIKIATNSGALSLQDAQTLMNDLSTAKNMDETYAALSRPKAGVVVDQLFGMQLGEDADITKARAEALDRVKALPKTDYTPSYLMFGQEMVRQNITNPFAPNVYTAPTRFNPETVVTPENFPGLLSNTVNRSFAGSNFVPTPMTPQFYSERGLEAEFIPFDQEGAPTFRSGVSGYTPTVPVGFQFGAPVVQAPVNVFTPGQFDPRAASYSQAGVPLSEAGLPLMPSSGGTVTSTRPEISQTVLGYTSYGEPIYAPMTTNDAGG
jgi:hypothetical protein